MVGHLLTAGEVSRQGPGVLGEVVFDDGPAGCSVGVGQGHDRVVDAAGDQDGEQGHVLALQKGVEGLAIGARQDGGLPVGQ
ncbi:hypothetical protein [Streptomyces sp. NPDC001568]|uniref:hypothetical protein n=1 Tax=Streptomyces sp. NPDC001568 TaxID=3364588 RepID=UPI003686A960